MVWALQVVKSQNQCQEKEKPKKVKEPREQELSLQVMTLLSLAVQPGVACLLQLWQHSWCNL